MNLDKSQLDFCNSKAEYIRLLAPAGSGKTLSLLWRCKSLFESSKTEKPKFLIFTFTRVAKDELSYRLQTDTDFTEIKNLVKIDTLNQWGFNYLKSIEKGLSLKANKKDRFFLVKNMLRPIWSNSGYKEIFEKKQNKYNDILNIFDSLKSLGFNHTIDDESIINHTNDQLAWIRENQVDRYFNSAIIEPLKKLGFISGVNDSFVTFFRFWQQCVQLFWESAVISLDDQKYWSKLKLDEKYPDNKLFPKPNRYNHILIDEFQDINSLDLELIKSLQRVNASTITIIGDDDQAIYEWRGSTPNIILKPHNHFGKKFESHILETNYRSPKNILDISQSLIKCNTNREPKNVNANSEQNAIIEHIEFPTHNDCLSFLLDYAKNANESREPKKLAIISRKKSQIIPIQIILTSEQITYYAKEDLNILLSSAFKDLKRILEIVVDKERRFSSEEVVKNFLHLFNKVKQYPLSFNLSKPLYVFLIKQKPKKLIEVLDIFLDYKGTIKGDVADYHKAISTILNTVTVADTIEAVGELFEGLKQHYPQTEDDIFFKDPPFTYLAEFARRYNSDYWGFIDIVETAISKMEEISMIDTMDIDSSSFSPIEDNSPSKNVKEPSRFEDENQTDELIQESFNESSNENQIDNDLHSSVHLMTALRAKGKEFDTVILLDVNEGLWPIKYASTLQEIEQERRVFYVALTRAKKRLIILSVNSILNKQIPVSRFINELGIKLETQNGIQVVNSQTEKKKGMMPNISEITIKNYFSIDDIGITFENLQNEREIFLVGDNGAGKTIILQGIALALKEEQIINDVGNILEQNTKSNPLFYAKDSEGQEYDKVFDRKRTEYKFFYAYGINRLSIEGLKHIDWMNGESCISVFNNSLNLMDPISWLKDLKLESLSNSEKFIQIKTVQDLLSEFLERDVAIEIEGRKVEFIEKGTRVTFSQLSDGYKSSITWISDLLARLSFHQPNAKKLSDFRGLVLVDEINEYIHPSLQFSLIKKILEKFSGIQWIFTTHSPIITLGASEKAIVYKVYKGKDGITHITKPMSVKGHTANSLITSTIWNVPGFVTEGTELEHIANVDNIYKNIHKAVLKQQKMNPALTEDDLMTLIENELAKK